MIDVPHAERANAFRQALKVRDVVARAREHHTRRGQLLPQQGRRRVIEITGMCPQAVTTAGQERHDVCERTGHMNEARVQMGHAVPFDPANETGRLRESRNQIERTRRQDAEQSG